jgi:hypothetical protein
MEKKVVAANRYRINSPKGKRELKDMIGGYTSVLQSAQENFNHFKFDSSGQEVYPRTNRNRLPQIYNINCNLRASSFEQRLEVDKSRLREINS